MSETAGAGMVRVAINSDAMFLIPEADPYWTADWAKGGYEQDMTWLLRRAADRPYALFDAGANYGYWSILASSAPFGGHSAIAIEPCRTNFEILLHNAAANSNRFQTLRRACLDETGKRATLYGTKHYGLSLRTDWHPDDVGQFEDVETITLDDVADRYLPERSHPALVKIDVEGSEIAAMRGARKLIGEGALIAYEDHGKEAEHPATRFVLSLADVDLWHVGADNQPTRITAIGQMNEIKTDPKAGYNLFFCRNTSPWTSAFKG